MRKILSLIACLILIASLTQAQESKPITWKDIPNWKYMPTNSFTLSPDGQWIAYGYVQLEGDGEIILQKVGEESSKKTFTIGSTNYPSLEFSEDSKWFAFTEYPTFSEKKAKGKNGGKGLRNKAILIQLGQDDTKEFENVSNYAFNGKAASVLAINLSKEGSGEARGSDLLIHHLREDKTLNIGNVADFSFNKSGSHLAYTIDAANESGNGLYLMDILTNRIQILDSDKATYRSINWTETGEAFAALKLIKDKKYKQDKGQVIGIKTLATPQVTVYDPAKDSINFDQAYTISPHKSPRWSEDLTRLFFGIHPLVLEKEDSPKKEVDKDSLLLAETAAMQKIMADTTIKSIADLQKAISKLDSSKVKDPKKSDADTPDMTIWHWNDSRLQSRQQVMMNQDKNYSFWAMYDVMAGKPIQLQDSSMRDLKILDKDRYALGADYSAYELDMNLDGQRYQDFYLVDLKTGDKKELFTKFYLPNFSSYPRESPDGTQLLYGQDGHFYIYDIPSGQHKAITEEMPVSFVNVEDDHNVTKPLHGALGWSSDSRYVLLRDGWDIWQVPVSGTKEKPLNLTQTGRDRQIRYQYRYALDPEEKGIDLSKPLYLRMYGEWSKKSGIAHLRPAKKGGLAPLASVLLWEDANISKLAKAKLAETYYFSREKFNEPTQFYVADATLSSPVQLSENAPEAENYTWSSGTQLVDYVSDNGDKLQGTLFLPAGYVEGEKYPTVVYFYEKLSQTRHNWYNPSFPGTGWSPTIYTSNGFAVFIPDIVYTLDDPGMSAVWCVIPAVKEALKTGIIDENNIGIHGHSWGGYQTSFLITQTDMFKAAAAGAPLTNMISMYDLIYWNSGSGNMAIFEASQGRFKTAPWENWEAYERNSPVYHVKNVRTPLLLLHNDEDGAVDFTQGVEYYSALRRLKKPVVMVQYKGENHGLSKPENRKDYAVRMMEFFEHHLKGKPAPGWWENGVNLLDLDSHLKERAF